MPAVVLGAPAQVFEKTSTATTSNVAGSTSTFTILAANADRLGATIYNDTNKAVYLKLGSGASATDHFYPLPKDGYIEVPFGYDGIITGLGASGISGNLRVMELT